MFNKFGKLIKKEPVWFVRDLISVVVLGVILVLILMFIVNPIINPNPKITKTCYSDNDEIKFLLNNPSRAPAEDFNMIIYERYGGGGKSYADNELCNADTYYFQPLYTLIHCDYIPPNSKINIGINFENKTQTEFDYSSWGKTTPKEDFEESRQILICN